jgi:hypothetical protein
MLKGLLSLPFLWVNSRVELENLVKGDDSRPKVVIKGKRILQ